MVKVLRDVTRNDWYVWVEYGSFAKTFMDHADKSFLGRLLNSILCKTVISFSKIIGNWSYADISKLI